MASERSLQLAAQAWCCEKTANKIMDTDLAEAFAEILDKEDERAKISEAKLYAALAAAEEERKQQVEGVGWKCDLYDDISNCHNCDHADLREGRCIHVVLSRPKSVRELKARVSRCLRHFPPLLDDGMPLFSNDDVGLERQRQKKGK